ncbi:MAG: glycosyltransferase family 2 protein [Candidatus Kerfeldbacteria bacterium]|nr:glycosyltransferase family 2 protein [Candidatus Kerfeldbacteria bacterium]
MDLSIIIASWNVKQHLYDCLQSIYHYTAGIQFEVIVVDNASSDGSATMVAEQFPQVRLVCNAVNRGFGAANNQGIAIATGQHILFLNDDTAITDNIFPTVMARFKNIADQSIGLIGCSLRNPDGTIQASVRRFPTVWDQSIILLKLHHFVPALLNRYIMTTFNYQSEQTVDQVMGAFMLVPKLVLERVGIFDEHFFNWFEEVDLQRRIQQAGWQVLYTPVAHCIHVRGASFKQWRRPQAQTVFNQSMRYYFGKHHSKLAQYYLTSLQPISMLLSYVAQTFS